MIVFFRQTARMSSTATSIRIRISNSWQGWQEVKNIYDGELRAIDEALKVRKRVHKLQSSSHDDFANHLLDVHRNWCEACPTPGGRRGGREERSSAGVSESSTTSAGTDVIVLNPNSQSMASSKNRLVGTTKKDQATQTIQDVFSCCHCGLPQLDKPMPPLARIQPASQHLVGSQPTISGQQTVLLAPGVRIQQQTVKRSDDINRPSPLQGVPSTVKVIKVIKSKGGVQGQQSGTSSQAVTNVMPSGHLLLGTPTGSSVSSVGAATGSGKNLRTIVVNVPATKSSGFLRNVPTALNKLSTSSVLRPVKQRSNLVDPLSCGGIGISESIPVVKTEPPEDLEQLRGPMFSQTKCVDENDDDEDHVYDDGNINLDHETELESTKKVCELVDHPATVTVKEEVLSDVEQPDTKLSEEEEFLYDPTQDQGSNAGQSSGTGGLEEEEKADAEMEDEEEDEEYNELEDEMEDEMEDEEEIDYEKQEKADPTYDPTSRRGKSSVLRSKKGKVNSDPVYTSSEDHGSLQEDPGRDGNNGVGFPDKPGRFRKGWSRRGSRIGFPYPANCPLMCSYVWKSAADKTSHMSSHLPTDQGREAFKEAIESLEKRIGNEYTHNMGWCDECDKFSACLPSHLKSVHRRRDKLCPQCGKMIRVGAMKSHMLSHVHVDEKDYAQCPMCPARVKHREYLKQHMSRCHFGNDERSFTCSTCGKNFRSQHALNKHVVIHSSVKPFPCTECDKAFSQQSNLKIHMRQHTGHKPYGCEICEASFTNKVSLKNHKKKLHGIDWWKDRESLKDDDLETTESLTS
ncbi:zinc finger protein 652-B-like [Lytechinus variegatus]|uniref:zinc finger protein 652-B-like n=1 Tax=Lytechinus variegatus TaxID=7654 RepID=UPI001BB26F5B|nr:zinc finger protein 652-B-like [Lytechinus variegatus]